MLPGIIISICLAIMAITGFLINWKSPSHLLLATNFVLPTVIGTAAFILRDLINERWYKNRPKTLDDVERNILEKHFPYYRYLIPKLKLEFQKRIYNFKLQKVFQMQMADQVPGDIALLTAASAIQVTFGMKEYIYPNLGVLIFYIKPFKTPAVPYEYHAVEWNEDMEYHCGILAIDMFVKGLKEPQNAYNIGIHLFGRALQSEMKINDDDIPFQSYGGKTEFAAQLAELRGFKNGYQQLIMGVPNAEVFPMCVEHFFQMPEKFQKKYPLVYEYFVELLKQDAMGLECPVPIQVEG